METERREDEGNERAHGILHVALARKTLSDPVAERTALCDAAADIRECATAHQHVVFRPKDEEGIGRVEPRFLLVALDASAEGTLSEFVARPDRFPGSEKGPALA